MVGPAVWLDDGPVEGSLDGTALVQLTKLPMEQHWDQQSEWNRALSSVRLAGGIQTRGKSRDQMSTRHLVRTPLRICTLGIALTVGIILGEAEGLLLGSELGTMLGKSDGLRVGRLVGTPLVLARKSSKALCTGRNAGGCFSWHC